jgi:hypothetical protein
MYKVSISKRKENLFFFFPESLIFFLKYLSMFINISKFKKKVLTINDEVSKGLVILGNGPSLNIIHSLEYKKNKWDFFAVNNFPNSKDFFIVKPKYLTFVDSMFWLKNEILEESIAMSVQNTFESLDKATWKIILFAPNISENVIRSRINNSNIELIFFPDIGYEFESDFFANLSLGIGMLPPRVNVVVTSISISFLLNYKIVELVGMDMNRIMDINVDQSSNDVGFIHRHFNSDKKINSKNKILGRQSNNMYIRL